MCEYMGDQERESTAALWPGRVWVDREVRRSRRLIAGWEVPTAIWGVDEGMGEREWWSGVWRYWWSGTLDKGLLAGEGCLNETGSGCGRDLAIIELCLTGPSP